MNDTMGIPEPLMSLVKRRKRSTSYIRKIRNIVSCHPAIYIPLVKCTNRAKLLVSRDTEIVIEGFPRSGNSFAEVAFRLAQPGEVQMAHHCHSAAQIMTANRWRIPALVLFRSPDDAVTSLLMFSPERYTACDAYHEYILFYRAVLGIREGYVLASFEAITRCFGDVIGEINRRFGTNFEEFSHTKEMAQRAFDEVDRLTKIRRNLVRTECSPLQDEEYKKSRAKMQTWIKGELLIQENVARVRAEAQKVYEDLLAAADL